MFSFYLTAMIGSGTRSDPYRCKLHLYADTGAGDWYADSSSVSRLFTLAFMGASTATHAAANADAEILRVTPLKDTKAELRTALNNQVGPVPQGLIDKLEAYGIPANLLLPTHTYKQVLRYMIKNIFMTQRAEGQGDENFKQFLRANLDTRNGDISLAIRQRAKAWMEERDLDTNWINANTLVREVLHYISDNTTLPIIGFGGIDL